MPFLHRESTDSDKKDLEKYILHNSILLLNIVCILVFTVVSEC